MRSQRYRFIRYADGSEELYDHRTDPHEWTNLATHAEHNQLKQELANREPDRVQAMAAQFEAWRQRVEAN